MQKLLQNWKRPNFFPVLNLTDPFCVASDLCKTSMHPDRSKPNMQNVPPKKTTIRTYVFGAVEADGRPLPVARAASQLTGIRTFSWTGNVRNMTQSER